MNKLKIAVVFGGVSSEHEVSLVTAASIMENLDRNKYEVLPLRITKKGRCLYSADSIQTIKNNSFKEDSNYPNAIISPDRMHHGIIKLNSNGSFEIIRVDCVFLALHGKNGEDGTVQGLCELAGIPYVGCGVASSANCMDKILSHTILDSRGIQGVKWEEVKEEDLIDLSSKADELADKLSLPIFVKPSCFGSSVGISKAKNKEELQAAINLAFKFDKRVICEQAIAGKEVECAVLGNENVKASILGRIIPCNEFYDYDAKYKSESKLEIPADLNEETVQNVQKTAIKAYKIMGCEGLARVDFLISREGRIYLNEINTIPGFTSISMYPKLWEASGLCYKDLLEQLISLAIERNNKTKRM